MSCCKPFEVRYFILVARRAVTLYLQSLLLGLYSGQVADRHKSDSLLVFVEFVD